MKVAVYGGSFDPPHLGHVMVVSHLLLNDPSVDQVLIVPCYSQTGKALALFEHRMTMCQLAFGWLPKVSFSDIELSLGGESVSLRTFQALKMNHPTWDLRFVMGSDLLASCKTWEGWEALEKIAPPMVIGRAGISPVNEGDPTPISPLVSSTLVRTALIAGDYAAAMRYLPSSVLKYIQDHKVYLGRE